MASLDSSTRELYEEWDLAPPTISPRSKLFRLAPIGIGTPYVESLSSYFRRLAEAHCVSSSALFEKSVAPMMGKQYLAGTSTKWHSFLGANYRYVTINSVGSMASDWIRCLEKLTLRKDLRALTMSVWCNVVSARELFHDKPHWCTACLNTWRETDQVIREPLIWTLRPVQKCDLHSRRLIWQCPHCQRNPQPLCVTSRPGHCSYCKRWLGDETTFEEKLDSADQKWQTWVIQGLGQMLIAAPSISEQPPRARIVTGIAHLTERLCDGNSAAFANQIGRTKTTVWGWINSDVRIRISDLLAICYWAQLMPVDLLLNDLRVLPVRKRALLNSFKLLPLRDCKKPMRVVRRLDKSEIKAQLEDLLKSGNVPATWKEVAALVKIDMVHLRRLFPELSKLLATECKKTRAFNKANRDRTRRAEIDAAIAEAQNEGSHVSRRAVASILKQRGKVVDDRLLLTAFREIRGHRPTNIRSA